MTTSDPSARLAAALTDLLAMTGVRQADLAARLGVAQSSVTRWMQGDRGITLDLTAEIDAALELQPGTLLARARVCEPPADARSVILADPNIDPLDGFLLAGLYERARKRYQLDEV